MDKMSKKALIVDNDFFFVEFLAEVFQKKGYEAAKAYDGKEGISKLGQGSFDLISVDLVMPKIDGKEFIQVIRNQPISVYTPVIVVSGVMIERTDELREIGVDYYIAKGSAEEMEADINKVIDEIERSPVSSPSAKEILRSESIYPNQITMELMDTLDFQKAIIQSIPSGIIVVDKDARIIKANPTALDLIDKPLQDVLNSPATAIFSGNERTKLRNALKEVVHDKESKRVTLVMNLHSRKVRTSISLLRIDTKIGGWIIFLDQADNSAEKITPKGEP